MASAGCGSEPASLPSGCRAGAQALEHALAAAPGPVRVEGTPISRCMRDGATSADLQQLGAAVNGAAAHLADAAARRPESVEALRLGYLAAAVRRGARRTQGQHGELVRRVEQELMRVDRSSASFQRGLRAGRELG
jgi:hypothetical protein